MEFHVVARSPLLKRAFHSMSTVQNKVYLHGGVSKYNSSDDPLDDVVVFDPISKAVEKVACRNAGPRKSHHCSVAVEDRWICAIGGWDGRQRTTDVYSLDTDSMEWSALRPMANSTAPAGLSSHTCTKVRENEIIITGREGGVRMQRRYGSVYKLTIDIRNKAYCYSEMPTHISSRSGHTACLLKKESTSKSSKYSLVVYGGRDSNSVDVFGNWGEASVPSHKLNLEALLQSLLPDSSRVSRNKCAANIVPLKKPVNLRHHVSLSAGQFCLVQGGEVFGKARETVSGDLYLHNSTATTWWSVPVRANHGNDEDALKRMGHSICYLCGEIYVISGVGGNGKTAEASIIVLSLTNH